MNLQVWVGNGEKEGAVLNDIVLAIATAKNGSEVSATKVYGPVSDGAGAAGSGVDDISESFAKKLTSKLGKPVYFRQVPTHGRARVRESLISNKTCPMSSTSTDRQMRNPAWAGGNLAEWQQWRNTQFFVNKR